MQNERHIRSWEDVFFVQREFRHTPGRQLGTQESVITQSRFGGKTPRSGASPLQGLPLTQGSVFSAALTFWA